MSRELFDLWCDDGKNTVIIPGYMVKGTFAESIIREAPKEIQTLSGETKPCRIKAEVSGAAVCCHYSALHRAPCALSLPKPPLHDPCR